MDLLGLLLREGTDSFLIAVNPNYYKFDKIPKPSSIDIASRMGTVRRRVGFVLDQAADNEPAQLLIFVRV